MSLSSEANLPPVEFQEGVLSAAFNSILLATFLTGVYVVAYFGTLYIYLSRRTTATCWMVVLTLTIIFVGVIGQIAVQWHLTQWQFVNGESRESVFLSLFDTNSEVTFWTIVASDICAAVVSIFSDGLLIWRCFHIYNRSLRVILCSLILLIAELGLQLYMIIISCLKQQAISNEEAIVLNQLMAAAYLISFGCTLATTSLIAYRIYPIFSHNSLLAQSRGRFKRILDILVQSAAVYALELLVQAIGCFIPTNQSRPTAFVFRNYSSALIITISGLAPTLVVTRIAMTSDKIEAPNTPHISVLRFQGRSTQQTTHNRMNNPSAPAVEEGDLRHETEKGKPEMKTETV